MSSLKFGTAGVRGIFGRDFSAKDALSIGYGVGEVLGEGSYGIGSDSRRLSSTLTKLLIAELNWLGDSSVEFGTVPTPVLAFNVRELHLRGGFSITASHNPPEYAGVKVFNEEGMELSAELENMVEKKMTECRFRGVKSKYGESRFDREAVERYIAALLSRIPETSRRLKIVLDTGNGVGSIITPDLLTRLGHYVITVNTHLSWRATARGFEPNIKSLTETGKIVRYFGADLGVAYDGDSDRAVIIDREGDVVEDYIFSALMFKILALDRKGLLVLSVNTSNALEDLAREFGCDVARTRLGKTFHTLRSRGGIFATEPSKIVDPTWGYWEDGIYSSIALIQHISSTGVSLEKLMNDIPKYVYRQISLKAEELDYLLLRELIIRHYMKKEVNIDQTDGVKVLFKDRSWILFRISGTEPKIRIYAEAKEGKRVEELLGEGVKLFETYVKAG